MNASDGGVQSVYDFWLGLIPQFFNQMGAAMPAGDAAAKQAFSALSFPASEVAKAAAMTQDALQGLANAYAPLLQAAGPGGLLGQWAAASPAVPGTSPTGLTLGAPYQALQQAWQELGTQWLGATPRQFQASFDRTFGALTDAMGFGPARKLQAAWQELVAASLAQNEARAHYLMLVQGAFAAGLEGLLRRLAELAERGERVESVLALLRLWAVQTETAVHGVLQSEQGLAATAKVARAGLAYRRKIQHVASIIADGLDMATRRDLDEAYREIQELKREVRRLRPAARAGGRQGRAGAPESAEEQL